MTTSINIKGLSMTDFALGKLMSIALAAMLLCFTTNSGAFAGPKEEIAKIDQEVIDLNDGIEFNENVIKDLKREVRESRKKGIRDNELDWDKKLNPQGLQNIGVVGPGNDKPQVVQDIIKAAESDFGPLGRFNPKGQLLAGHARTALAKPNEVKLMTKKRREELGLSENEKLTSKDQELIDHIATQRSAYATEVERHKIFINIMRNKISKLEILRTKLLAKLTPEQQKKVEETRQDKLRSNRDKAEEDSASTEEPALEEEKKPPFDTRNLRVAFQKLNGLIGKQTALFQSVSNSCQAFPSREKIEDQTNKLANTPYKDLPLNVDLLRKEKVLSDRLLTILQEITALEDNAFTDGDAACKVNGTGELQIEPIRAAGARSQQAGEAAKVLLASAKKIHNELVSSHATKAGDPNVDYLNFLSQQAQAAQKQCRRIGAGWDKARSQMGRDDKGAELESAAQIALAQLKIAKDAGYEHWDTYEARYDLYEKYKRVKQANTNTIAECNDRARYLDVSCFSLHDRFKERERIQAGKQNRLIDGIVANRKSQLAVANLAMSRINRMAARVYVAVVATDTCVAEAEAKSKQPDPQLIAEANGLAGPSGMSCDVADIDGRISRLKAPKFKDVQGIDQHIQNLTGKRNAVQAANARFSEARAQFSSGNIGPTHAALRAARGELAKLNGVPTCPDLVGKIEKGEAQTQQLDEILTSSTSALNSCKIRDINAALRKIGGKSKPARLVDLKGRLNQQMSVLNVVAEARAAFKAKQYERAMALLRRAKAAKQSAGRDCPVILQRIDNATAAVQRRQNEGDAEENVAAAARSCNSTVLKSFVAGYGGITKALKARADDALEICEAKEQDRKAENEAKEQSARVARCLKVHGKGYRPGKPALDGTYYCIPSRAVATRWCNNNNKGSGWSAQNINAKGGYDCKQNRKARRANARADCRRQAKSTGKVYAFTKFFKNGTYNCHTCQRGQRYRKGRCYSNQQQARRTYTCPKGYVLRGKRCYSRNGNNAAAAAAAIAIINSIARGAGGGGNTSNCRANPLAANC